MLAKHWARAPTIASLRTLYARRQTLYEHQLWLRGYLELKDVGQAANDRPVVYLQAQANEVNSIDELVVAANHWLYEQKLLIPGDRQVRDLARKCFATVEADILKIVLATVPALSISRYEFVVFGFYNKTSTTVLE